MGVSFAANCRYEEFVTTTKEIHSFFVWRKRQKEIFHVSLIAAGDNSFSNDETLSLRQVFFLFWKTKERRL